MHLKGILDEDFINYKVPSMHIATSRCNFKCDKEFGANICQNSKLAAQKTITMKNEDVIERYLANDITHAIVFAGLEPFDSFPEILAFTKSLRVRHKCKNDIVIYTGYCKDEIAEQIEQLKKYENIVIKYGRYIPYCERHMDDVLGVFLASPNQFGERIS